ncbi:hypothetical protein [Pseudomonas sp. FP2300]|uniref:hypothetical protein n=1 Tax=Pseudomonas sp. FP2300 TaxID=2954090 RepID=UPI002736363E|nr:hypothetical protein [Pseudomonas sp. FP2300]WLH61101.1 hypothetical protein PSH86_20490 [Pseudomonas sp. FP2300]
MGLGRESPRGGLTIIKSYAILKKNDKYQIVEQIIGDSFPQPSKKAHKGLPGALQLFVA